MPRPPRIPAARHAARHAARRAVRAALLAGAAALPARAPLGAQAAVGRPAPAAALETTLDAIARAPVARGEVAGLSVVVRRGRDTLLARGYGLADREAGTPMTVGHVLPIASLTKQFAAAAVLRFLEQGRLGLDDPVALHLPGAAAGAALQGRPVTVRQLLTHTAGLPDFADRPDPAEPGGPGAGRLGPALPESTLARVRGVPFDFAPGAELRYSNTGYLLLGMLVERLAGEPLDRHLARTLFRPAGMATARGCGAPVPGYRHRRAGLERAAWMEPSVAHAAGGTYLCASALDLTAWNAALHGGRVLRPASYATMTTGATVGGAGGAGRTLRSRYGFGVLLTPLAGRHAVHHGGDVRGFTSHLAYLPGDSLSVALLLNTEGPVRPAALADRLAAAVLGDAPAAEPAGGPAPSPRDLAPLAGRYGDGSAAFAASGDGLAFVWDGGPPEPLRWLGGTTFTNGPARFTFETRAGAPPAVWADLGVGRPRRGGRALGAARRRGPAARGAPTVTPPGSATSVPSVIR
jgi:CubicO group peptidase (beta-lactamase class C family)